MTRKLDLVLINPASRTQVYQSLGTELAAVENPVWAGLMATFCRAQGAVGRDHRRRGRGARRRPRSPTASSDLDPCWPRSSSTAISRPPRRRS